MAGLGESGVPNAVHKALRGRETWWATKRKRSFALRAAVLCAALALALGFGARPAVAAPFAYVENSASSNVSVIDTATNTLGTPIALPGATIPSVIAADGAHAYVANFDSSSTVWVIATATNALMTTIALPEGSFPHATAFTPDGAHAYVANFASHTISVIDTATNTLGTPIVLPAMNFPNGIAITPDGAHAYMRERPTPSR